MINLKIHTDIADALFREYRFLSYYAKNVQNNPALSEDIDNLVEYIKQRIENNRLMAIDLLPGFMWDLFNEYWEEDAEKSIISQLFNYDDAAMICEFKG